MHQLVRSAVAASSPHHKQSLYPSFARLGSTSSPHWGQVGVLGLSVPNIVSPLGIVAVEEPCSSQHTLGLHNAQAVVFVVDVAELNASVDVHVRVDGVGVQVVGSLVVVPIGVGWALFVVLAVERVAGCGVRVFHI